MFSEQDQDTMFATEDERDLPRCQTGTLYEWLFRECQTRKTATDVQNARETFNLEILFFSYFVPMKPGWIAQLFFLLMLEKNCVTKDTKFPSVAWSASQNKKISLCDPFYESRFSVRGATLQSRTLNRWWKLITARCWSTLYFALKLK